MSNSGPGFFERLNTWMRRSLTLRIVTITILILLLLIPLAMVEDLIREREWRKNAAIEEVSEKWGGAQRVTGPFITIPYDVTRKVLVDKENDDEKYELQRVTHQLHVLPKELSVDGQLSTELRYRGIFEVIVYNTDLDLTGSFGPLDTSLLEHGASIRWEDATINVGISDVRSIEEAVVMEFGDRTITFGPGVPVVDVVSTGISAKLTGLSSAHGGKQEFSTTIRLKGSNDLMFVPMGEDTDVRLRSAWNTPSFTGAYLPDDRDVSDGFTAHWNVLHLNRTFPQTFIDGRNDIDRSAFGVDLLMPVDEYQKSTRSAKYGVMIITLSFLVFFFVQILKRVRIHPVQYLLVGLALCVFFTLLIALGEHIKFDMAYLVSAVAVITLITVYARSVFKNAKAANLLAGIQVIIFGFIFTIVQLEDFALLIGSIGLFVTLAIVMMYSRQIDWYAGQHEDR